MKRSVFLSSIIEKRPQSPVAFLWMPTDVIHSLLYRTWTQSPLSLMAVLHFSLSPRPLKPPRNPNPNPNPSTAEPKILCNSSKRDFILNTASLCAFSLSAYDPFSIASADTSPSSKSILSAIANTKTWFQFFGDGFSIRVPPEFEDIMEPEVKFGFSRLLFCILWLSKELFGCFGRTENSTFCNFN